MAALLNSEVSDITFDFRFFKSCAIMIGNGLIVSGVYLMKL
jgi:hypothetical protein